MCDFFSIAQVAIRFGFKTDIRALDRLDRVDVFVLLGQTVNWIWWFQMKPLSQNRLIGFFNF